MKWDHQQLSIQTPMVRYIKASLNKFQMKKPDLRMFHTRGRNFCIHTVIKCFVRRKITQNNAQTSHTTITNHWFFAIQCLGNKQHNEHENKSHSIYRT